MEKQVKLMNEYVADLAVLNVKFHNLHWNVVGQAFAQVHVHFEEVYDDLFEKFDEVAERIKMMGFYAKASMKSYLELSDVEELGEEDISIKDSFNIAVKEIEGLKNKAIEVRNEADANDDFISVALMEDHIAGYDKELWFLRSALK
ncbi:MAG: Dps family protein [Candidatus Izemoplasmatales bacterium]